MVQNQISNNDNVLFNLPPASVQVHSNNDEKQNSNNNQTMDQVQQLQ